MPELMPQHMLQHDKLLMYLEAFMTNDALLLFLLNNVHKVRFGSQKVTELKRNPTTSLSIEMNQNGRVVNLPSCRKETSALG